MAKKTNKVHDEWLLFELSYIQKHSKFSPELTTQLETRQDWAKDLREKYVEVSGLSVTLTCDGQTKLKQLVWR